MPLAPGLFSTMIGWPQASVSFGPIWRARMSEVPPAAYGTMMRIGLWGRLRVRARKENERGEGKQGSHGAPPGGSWSEL